MGWLATPFFPPHFPSLFFGGLIHMRVLVVLPKKKAGLIREGSCFVYKLKGKTQERKEGTIFELL